MLLLLPLFTGTGVGAGVGALLLVLMLLFADTADAQNFSAYEPSCVTTCVQKALQGMGSNAITCAGLDDNRCLCENFSPITLSSIPCFLQTCQYTEPQELRTNVTNAWTKFCNDSGVAINISGPGFPFPTGPPSSSALPTTSTTPASSSSSSPTTTTTSPTTVPQNPNADASSGSSNSGSGSLSTAAKAGIGVGAGIGALFVIGSLLFLGFYLGQRRKKKKNNNNGDDNDNDNSSIIVWPFSRKEKNNNSPEEDGGAGAGAGADKDDKPQLKGRGLAAELDSGRGTAELHGREVGELPVEERVLELGAVHEGGGVAVPFYHELSQDAEVPRSRILQHQQQDSIL